VIELTDVKKKNVVQCFFKTDPNSLTDPVLIGRGAAIKVTGRYRNRPAYNVVILDDCSLKR
jgi:hypothetical protein